MIKEITGILFTKGLIDLAIRLVMINGTVWSTAGAIVFVIKNTRVKKAFGMEYDPEKPHTERRTRS